MGNWYQRTSSFRWKKWGNDDVEAFANIALAGDLSGRGNTFDHGLAADYLRLVRDRDTPNARFFKKEGIKPAQAPQGFFVYNYGSAGIFRRADWMVTLKGYTTDVWGLKSIQKIIVTGVIRVMVRCRSWEKETPFPVSEAALYRRVGIGTACRVRLLFICPSSCWIVR